MTPQKRKELESRRIVFQQKQQATEFVNNDIRPFIEILQSLRDKKVNFQVVEFINEHLEWKILFDNILSESHYAEFELYKIPQINKNHLIHELLHFYPSENSFRYVPGLKLMPFGTTLKLILKDLKPGNQKVYYYYFNYPFMLEISLSDFIKINEEELFNFWHGDVVIFPKTYDWLIAFSMEEEWRYGMRLER